MNTVNVKCNKVDVAKLVEKTLRGNTKLIFKASRATGERNVPTLIDDVAAMYWDFIMDAEGFEFDKKDKKIEVLSIKDFINDLEVTA